MHPALQRLKVRPPVRVERDDLAVDDRAMRAERAVQARELRVPGGDVVAVATLEAQLPGTRVCDRADAVPLQALERAAVPDRDLPRAVLALRYLPGELEVLERMVLGRRREAVLARVEGDPVRHRPRREHAVVLEAQVPVQPPRVMLVDHE